MSLFPITLLDPTTAASGFNTLSSGTLVVIPLDMTTVVMTQVTVVQASLTQDYSLRGWISVYPDGIALASVFPILRGNGLPIVVYAPLHTPPEACIPIAVPASGIYYLNVLNLTNESNVFAFTKTDLEVDVPVMGAFASAAAGSVAVS